MWRPRPTIKNGRPRRFMRSRPGFGLDIYRGISRAGGGSNGGNRDIFSQLDGVFHLHSQKHLVLDNVANHLAGLAVGLQDLLQACRRALRGFQRAQRELKLPPIKYPKTIAATERCTTSMLSVSCASGPVSTTKNWMSKNAISNSSIFSAGGIFLNGSNARLHVPGRLFIRKTSRLNLCFKRAPGYAKTAAPARPIKRKKCARP